MLAGTLESRSAREQEKRVFVIPARIVKNKADRVVILNDVARSVIESLRGKHGTFVFTRDSSQRE